MQTVRELIESGMDVFQRHDKDGEDMVKRALQREYYKLCTLTDWVQLRNSVELVFTGNETDGKYLPSNLINVTGVVCESDGEETVYRQTREERRYVADGRERWYYPNVQVTPLVDKKRALSASQGTTTVTGVGADHTGEFLRAGSEPGYYEITSYNSSNDRSTISPKYWGPKLSSKAVVVRPSETRKLQIIDSAGDNDDTTVQVYYWGYPPPLYRDSDVPRLPTTRALELRLWIALIAPVRKRKTEADGYKQELPDAEAEMMSANPRSVEPMRPVGRRGRRIRFGRHR